MNRRKVILDVDPGVDDMAAILLALASPELEIVGICAGAGNVPRQVALENAQRILAMAKVDIPLLAGCEKPLLRDQVFGRHCAHGVFPDNLVPPAGEPKPLGAAAAFIAKAARSASARGEAITLCASGPLSAVALALALGEDVRSGIDEITIMGGAFRALGNLVPWAEFNMLADPHAAAMVFASGVPITLFPLDVTLEVLVTGEHLGTLRANGGAIASAFADVFVGADREDPVRYGRPGGPVHDALPIAYLLAPELFAFTTARLGIVSEGPQMGHTFADFSTAEPGAKTQIAQTADEAAVLDLLCSRLAGIETTSRYPSERIIQ
ncbi:MAG: nucleoside hydrolase [Pelagibacterium sp.]|uniref:nucleoside hydrolase n=1 Tax=Pelagibacterium sp. TaxID=1967288 RepID=UPI0032EB513C